MEKDASDVRVRPLAPRDLPAADQVMRTAFGTFLKLPDPASFLGDADLVLTRYAANPSAAFAAEMDDAIVGSSFAARWGSVGFFGPLTVRPDLWDRKIAQALLEPTLGCFDAWKTTHAGLFTFPSSAKHLGLYQKFGFWPQHLNPVMWKRVRRAPADARAPILYSSLAEAERGSIDAEHRALTDAIYSGLDVTSDVHAVLRGGLGDTLFVRDDTGLAAFAVCHAGPRTEAGSGALYVKFGAARSGPRAASDFDALMLACEVYASSRGLLRFVAGVSTARIEAYRAMLARGFKIEIAGITMVRGDDPGYRRPGVFVLDDWR